jgi:hypothetical protein
MIPRLRNQLEQKIEGTTPCYRESNIFLTDWVNSFNLQIVHSTNILLTVSGFKFKNILTEAKIYNHSHLQPAQNFHQPTKNCKPTEEEMR